ncbi:uncharacterized protein LOC143906941 [Temnothorax americanus]|uniref:uncharacterized protein LOC143906941 n=1 Tax=Temnothorax americanus TaxID=1964332 RepID=UPI0040685FE8
MWLDSGKSFGEHVARVASKAAQMANCLARLMPNLGGAGGACVVSTSRWSIRCCYTQLYADMVGKGATVLAEKPPAHLVARMHALVYENIAAARGRRQVIVSRARALLRLQGREALLQWWFDWLSDPRQASYGRKTAEAVQPVLAEWVEGRKYRYLAFHAVQVLTGHGCFSAYLHRIGKERTTCCYYCPGVADTA